MERIYMTQNQILKIPETLVLSSGGTHIANGFRLSNKTSESGLEQKEVRLKTPKGHRWVPIWTLYTGSQDSVLRAAGLSN
ncbi:MAG: hypothetical protein WCX17_01755 [Parcubacteria group bacterium]